MNTSTRRLLGGLAAAAVLFLGQAGFVLAASPAPASPPSGPTGNEMLSVQPSLISVSVKPGSAVSQLLTLRAAADLGVAIASQGLAQGTDGSFKAVGETEDSSPYSARTIVNASPQSLRLHRGDSATLNVTITVPPDAGAGTRYSILTITGTPSSPAASANVGFGVELGVSTIIQIADTAQTKTGEIRDISVDRS